MFYSIIFLAAIYLDMSIFIDFNYKMLFSFILYKCPETQEQFSLSLIIASLVFVPISQKQTSESDLWGSYMIFSLICK